VTTKEFYIACSDPSCCDVLLQPTDLSNACNTAHCRTTGSYMSCPNPPLPVTVYQFPHLAHFFYPDNGDRRFLRNISNHNLKVSHPRCVVKIQVREEYPICVQSQNTTKHKTKFFTLLQHYNNMFRPKLSAIVRLYMKPIVCMP